MIKKLKTKITDLFKKNKKTIDNDLEIIENCYEDLNISLHRWGQYQTTNDYNWFRNEKDFDGRQPRIVSKYLENIEEKLNNDYFELIDDKTYKDILQKRLKCSKVITRYVKIVSICNRFKMGFSQSEAQKRYEYIIALKKLGFEIPLINTEEGDEEEINKVIYQSEQLKNQISILSKDLQTETSNIKTSLEKQLIQVCLSLETKILKTRDISVIEFIEMTKILQEKHEILKQAQEKNKSKD